MSAPLLLLWGQYFRHAAFDKGIKRHRSCRIVFRKKAAIDSYFCAVYGVMSGLAGEAENGGCASLTRPTVQETSVE
ncbi:hypothetical protein AGJ45_05860, partial [Cronobacter dublinensis subsp. dublinensis]|nr:hypothetical protein [Cronobacter dublinensis subsp. dublinensis]